MITKFGIKEGAAPSKKRKAGDTKKPTKKSLKEEAVDVDADEDDADANGDDKKKKKVVKKPTAAKKRAIVIDGDDEEAEDDEPKAKKARTKPMATNSANQALAEAFAELSGFEFKRGEKFKGGTWSKVAKAVRDSEEKITTGKQAMKLKGIGKSSAAKIDEFLETGTLEKLEEYRAGNM